MLTAYHQVRRATISASPKRLLLALSVYADDASLIADVHVDRLADDLGLSRSRVQQLQREAVGAGVLQILINQGAGGRNRYIIQLPTTTPETAAPQVTPPVEPATPPVEGATPLDSVDDISIQGDSTPKNRGVVGSTPGGIPLLDDLVFLQLLIQRAGIHEPARSDLAQLAHDGQVSAEDVDRVLRAIATDRKITNPAAFAVAHVKRNGWTPHKPKREPADRTRYVGGKYADLIMH